MTGATGVRLAEITASGLDPATVLDAVRDESAGGTALFCGTVRDHAPGVTGTVVGLQYSAHPDAAARMREVADSVAAGFADRGQVYLAVVHRTGTLGVGELAIVAAASAAHRDLAFDACRLLVDRVKAEIPIWKRELTADGGSHWVGLPVDRQP